MAEDRYDFEKIWERLNLKLDLKKFKKAKTEKQRTKLFDEAIKKDKFAKNILRMKRTNQRKILNFGIAQSVLDDGETIRKSVKRFKPERRRKISVLKGKIKKLRVEETLLAKAEAKGIEVRELKVRPTKQIIKKGKFIDAEIGRKPTQKFKRGDVTISKQFKFGKRTVRAIYKKGIRGAIALEEV